MFKFALVASLILVASGRRVSKHNKGGRNNTSESLVEEDKALTDKQNAMLDAAKNMMEQMNAMYADLATLGTNHTAEDEGLTKLGEICCMCTDGHKVKDGEDYGYDNYFEMSSKLQECMDTHSEDGCLAKCRDDGMRPYTQLNPMGCYDENMLAMLAPYINSAGLAKIKRDSSKPGDYC